MKKKFPIALILISILMLVCELFSALLLSRHSSKEFIVAFAPAFIICIGYIVIISATFKSIYKNLAKIDRGLQNAGAEYLDSLPAMSIVLDENGCIIWYNKKFEDNISGEKEVFGLLISDYMNINMTDIKNEKNFYCGFENRYYNVNVKKHTKNEVILYTVYLNDQTEFINLEKLYIDTRQTVMIIMIDSYDDLMQNAKESLKAKTSVETEQLLESFMLNSNGIIKKMSDDTFIAVLENQYVNEIIEGKFLILDGAREIKIGERSNLTLSIGVGQGGCTLVESEKFARECLDMALGRGGDQAVVKTENGFRFFGGVSKGVEKKSRAKIRIITNTLQEFINKSNRIFIMGHSFGDLDSIGSASGLAGAIRLMNKEAYVVVDRKRNLATQLIEMIEYRISDEELFLTPSEALDAIDDDDLLIIVDTHNKDFLESCDLYKKSKTVVVIDHHRKTVNFIDNAVIFHHEPYASSASEMVTEIIQYLKFNSSDLNSCYADALMSGITLDTKNFVMRTGVRTFEAAAFLKKIGADTVTVKMLFANSIESYKRRTKIVSSAIIHNRCAIATANIKSDDIRLISPQAADELLGISDVDASFVIFKTGDIVNISARSLGATNVQLVMESLGGGGHQTMAATQLSNTSIDEAVLLLKKSIDENRKG